MDQDQQRAAIAKRLEALDTAIICDVFDERGWPVLALDNAIQSRTEGRRKFAGYAYTVEGQYTAATGADRRKLEVVDATPAGSVAVWSSNGARGICLFGDLLAATMHRNGCKGAVVDGGFRDRDAIGADGFGVFARYTSPVQAVGRWRVTRSGEPVCLTGAFGELVTVNPGDYLLADGDGVVVVPQGVVEEILERAEQIVADEREARKLGASGMSTQEMLDTFGHV